MHVTWNRQFFIFIAVGLVSNFVTFMLFLALVGVGMSPQISFTVTFIVGLILAFSLNRVFTFNVRSRSLSRFFKYAIFYAVGYVACLSLLSLFIDVLGLIVWQSQAVVTVIFAVCSFVVQRLVIFGGRDG